MILIFWFLLKVLRSRDRLGRKIIHSFAYAVNNDSLGWHNLQAYVASGKGCESFLQRQLLQIANATSPFASLSFNKMFQKLFNISQVQNCHVFFLIILYIIIIYSYYIFTMRSIFNKTQQHGRAAHRTNLNWAVQDLSDPSQIRGHVLKTMWVLLNLEMPGPNSTVL